MLMAAVCSTAGCSGEDGTAGGPTDGGGDQHTADAEADGDAGADVPAETFGVPLCTELGVDNVYPYAVIIADEFAARVIDDCNVMHLLLTLTPDEGNLWFENATAWTSAFFGCPGTDGSVTSFGLVETGKSPALTQTDIDTLVEYFAQGTEATLTLSAAQSDALRSELAAVGAPAVNLPIEGHALSLCTDAGAGGAAGADGGAGAGGSGGAADSGGVATDSGVDAAGDAEADANDAGTDS
jgi:hypothetical protein